MHGLNQGLNTELIRSEIDYHQARLMASARGQEAGARPGAMRRAIGSFAIRIGERLQGERDTNSRPSPSSSSRLALQ